MDLRVQGQSELDKAQLSDRDQQLNPLSPQGPGPDPSAWQSGGADNSLQRSLERLSHQLQWLQGQHALLSEGTLLTADSSGLVLLAGPVAVLGMMMSCP